MPYRFINSKRENTNPPVERFGKVERMPETLKPSKKPEAMATSFGPIWLDGRRPTTVRMRTAASKTRLGQNVASLKVSAPTKFFLLLDYLLKALPSQKFAVYDAFSHVRDVCKSVLYSNFTCENESVLNKEKDGQG